MTDYKISPELLAEITAERQRQIDKGHTAERDDNSFRNNQYHWGTKLNTAVFLVKRSLNDGDSPARRKYPAYRKNLKEIAALAIAACESYDRIKKGISESDTHKDRKAVQEKEEYFRKKVASLLDSIGV